MKYLIDTNIFIFLADKDYSKLSLAQEVIIDGLDNQLFMIEASLYEIAIKIRIGKPDFNRFGMQSLDKSRRAMKIKLIKSKIAHYENIPNVPKILKKDGKPHADPFDLLIISTAEVEKLSILSSDEYFPDYSSIQVIF